MTYIGQQPSTTFDSGIQDRFTGLSSNTVTLTHDISAETDILVVWNNIVQDSGTYSVGGTGNKTLTLGGTLVSADVVTVYYLNKVMQSVNPTAGSVTSTTITDDIISGQTALGATPADTDEFLVSDAGTLKRIDYSYIKGSHAKLFSNTSVSGTSLSIGSSVITSAYTRYLMIIQNLKSDSDNSSLYLRHSTDNNSSSINSLTDTFVDTNNSGGGGSFSTIDITNNLNAKLTDDVVGSGGNEGANGFVYLFIDTTKPKHGTFKLTHTNSNHVYQHSGSYYVDSNDTVNAISIRPSGGSFNQGTIEIYGLA